MGKKLRLYFCWYDLWIGVYWDRTGRMLYICPLPTIVLAIYIAPRAASHPQPGESATEKKA